MNRQLSSPYWSSALAFFTFFLAWSFAYSLFPLWLNQTLHLSGKETGIVFAINSFAALFVMPLYGIIQDKLGTGKQLLYILAIIMTSVGPFFVFIYQPLLTTHFYVGALIGAVFSAIAFGAAVGTLEAFIERLGRQYSVEFGKARLWGSLGWAAATFIAGSLFNINPHYNFWLASVSGLCFLFFLHRLPSSNNLQQALPSDRPTTKEVFTLFRKSSFWRLSAFVMGVSCLYQIYDQQFPIYFASLFPNMETGNRFYGYLNSMQVFLEALMMFIAPYIVNRIGPKYGLILSGAIMALRMLASGIVDGPILISLIKLLHALELPILLVALFKYIVANFDKRLSATIYLIGFHVITQVITAALSPIIGNMYDEIGFANAYLLLGGVVVINLLLSFYLLEKGNRKLLKMTGD